MIFEGMNKMVVNHLEKLFVTNDAATIIKELEVSRSILNNDTCRLNLYKKGID